MNIMKVVQAPINATYLGDFMTDLPDNCIFNKVTTGCGMTSLVLTNSIKYVVAMPYINLIKNKSEWCSDRGVQHLAIYADGDSVDSIQGFSGSKILCTYDALEDVTAKLNTSEWKLLVDEAHILLTSAGFRRKAVQGVLNSYSKYSSYVFGSATHHSEEDQLTEMKGLDRVLVEWSNLSTVNVKFTKVDSGLDDSAAIVVGKHVNKLIEGNAHIFVNSVSSILSIIKKAGLKKDVRIVCSMNEYNNARIESFNKSYNTKFSINTVGSPLQVINFYTSTAFEGVDVFDEDGKNYVVVDGRKDYSKIDILTTLPQIIGRVRDSKYKGVVELLFSPNIYFSNSTEEEFKDAVQEVLKVKRKTVNNIKYLISNDSPEDAATLAAACAFDSYFYDEDGEVLVNELNAQAEMANWKNLHRTFYVSKHGGGLSAGIKELEGGVKWNWEERAADKLTGLNKALIGKKPDFSTMCIDYIESEDSRKFISALFPVIEEAFLKLGGDKMKALRFERKEIEKMLTHMSQSGNIESKVVKLLKYKNNSFVSSKNIKASLQAIYFEVGSNATAKATDIGKYYQVKQVDKKLKGETVRGYVIVSAKY